LSPETPYVVCLSNVCQEDVDRRVARFRTWPSTVTALRLVAVAGHSPPLRAIGPANPWAQLLALARKGPDVDVVLHLGCTVDVSSVATEAGRELAELQSYTAGAKRDKERNAKDILQGVFWRAWGCHEPLRRVLAEVGAHVPVFSPPLDLSQLRPAGEDVPALQALLRIGLERYREYQRALWQSATNGKADVRVDARTSASRFEPDALDERVRFENNVAHEFLTTSGTWSRSTVEEWHCHRYGNITIFALDTKSTFLSKGSKPKTLLGALQQQALAEVMQDRFTEVLILACDMPFAFEEDPEVTQFGVPCSDDEMPKSWSGFPLELQALLERLFEWKKTGYPAREVLLVSEGVGFGTTGDICDHKLGMNIPVVLVGPTLGRVCSYSGWLSQNTLADGRFSYVYRNPVDRWNFALIDIDISTMQARPAVSVQMVDVEIPPGTVWADSCAGVG